MSEAQSATAQLLKKVAKKKAPKAEAPAEGAAAEATVEKAEVKADANDFLVVTANQIENLNEADAIAMADKLVDARGENDFRLGGVLAVIQSKGWFSGYPNLKELVEQRYGIAYRKAMYLVGIYQDLVKNQVPWDKVKDIGWSKLKEISGFMNAENVDEWVVKAKSMTVLQLQDLIKSMKTSGSNVKEGATVTSTVTTMTFKVHPDQKETIRSALDKAKEEANTEYDTVALEMICVGYLGGSVEVQKNVSPPDLKALMKVLTPEDVLEAFEAVFPQINLTVEA